MDAFEITSSSIGADGKIPLKYTANVFGCTGQNLTPALAWKDPPAGTKSFALTVWDADAPTAPPSRYPGVDGHAQYSEGVFVGYRHYDRFGVEPLFLLADAAIVGVSRRHPKRLREHGPRGGGNHRY